MRASAGECSKGTRWVGRNTLASEPARALTRRLYDEGVWLRVARMKAPAKQAAATRDAIPPIRA